ncbi:MAG TPA: ATP-binding protein, partial [Thermomicrobiales bacterium]|nr:ATP-binding protein [Thermomicrobiales bacterium]
MASVSMLAGQGTRTVPEPNDGISGTDAAALRLAAIYRAVGLRSNPFRVDPGSGPFVAIPAHARAVETLLPWLTGDTGSGLGLVTGAPGSGRTRLMLHLGETLAARSRLAVATVHGGECRTDAQLLRAIIVALGEEPTGRTGLELTNRIRAVIDRNRKEIPGRQTVILIDDATFTGSRMEIVRTLLTLSSGPGIVLFGPPELRERIGRRRSLAGSLRDVVTLEPMDREAVSRFLDERIAPLRLERGNPTADRLFTEDAVTVVATWSRGNPGALMRIAG